MFIFGRGLLFLFFGALSSLIFGGCGSSLDSSGSPSYSLEEFYIQPNSSLRIYSYMNSQPDFLSSLEVTGQTVDIPRNIIVPTLEFGTPVNELIHTDRSQTNVAVPIDMFLKVYSPSSPAPDFYFEIPILGFFLTPTNVTTALSWILRWGFDNQIIYLSQNQFEEILTQVEVACINCRELSNSEMVDFILNDSHISNDILSKVNNSTPDFSAESINYTPPSLDYAWSSLHVDSNWEIITSLEEPEVDSQSGSYDPTELRVETLFIDPLDSTNKVQPQKWAHEALLLSSLEEGYVNLGEVNQPLLNYSFKRYSAGLHKFHAQMTEAYTNPPPLSIRASVIASNTPPTCLVSNIPEVRANKMFKANLDYSITPELSGNIDVNSRLVSSRVIFDGIDHFPSLDQGYQYSLEFVEENSELMFHVTKESLHGGSAISVLASQSYTSGAPIEFEHMSLNITGSALAGDLLKFSVPYPIAGQGKNEGNVFYDRFGCIDPNAIDPSNSSIFRFSKGPHGLTLSRTGQLQWLPPTNEGGKLSNLEFLFEDSLGMTYPYSINIRVTNDQLPRVCLTSEVDPQTGLCPPTSQRYTWPLEGAYQETLPINESVSVTDPDGDPLRIEVISRKRNNTTSYKGPHSQTSFTTFDLVSETWGASSSSQFDFVWRYTPHILQIEGDGVESGLLATRLRIFYDTGKDPTLSNSIIKVHDADLVIENTINAPSLVASPSAICRNGKACSPNNQSAYQPQYLLVHPDNNNNGQSPHGPLKDPKTLQNRLIDGKVINNPLREGEIATIQLPVIANSNNSLYEGPNPVLYRITNFNRESCPFLGYGMVKLEPSSCQGRETEEPECLTLYLNYNVATQTQEPLSYSTPEQCTFRIRAIDPVYPEAFTELGGTYTIYIQDINDSPYILPTAPEGPQDTFWFPEAPEIPESLYPVEGQPYDLKPFLNQVFGDTDFGPYNNQEIQVLDRAPETATQGRGPYELFKIKASAWAPHLHFKLNARPSHIPNSDRVYLEDSADGENWQAFSGEVFRSTGGAAGVVIETSEDFNGRIRFKRCTPEGNCSNTNARRINNTNTSFTDSGGTFFFSSMNNSPDTRNVHLESHTSGSVKAYVIGQYNTVGEASEQGQDIIELPAGITNYSLYTFPTEVGSHAGRLIYNSRMVAVLNPSRPYVRAYFHPDTQLNSSHTLPSFTFYNLPSFDQRENLDWECWLVDDQENYHRCLNQNSQVAHDTDGNPILDVPFPRIFSTDSPVMWTPPFSAAADGNLPGTTNPESSFDVVIRMIDKGFYPNSSNLPSPLDLTCNSGNPGVSCVDYRFPLKVIETPAAPTVQITRANDDPFNGAYWRPQDKSHIPLRPQLEVEEGMELEFKVKVEPYSRHAVDLYKVDFRQVSCMTELDACGVRPEGGFMLLEPYPRNGDLSHTSEEDPALSFTFKLNPNYFEGDGPSLGSDSMLYSYKYIIGRVDESGAIIEEDEELTTTFDFNVLVKNTNRPPTDIIFTQNAESDGNIHMCSESGTICNLSMSGGELTVRINRTTQPGLQTVSIPLSVVDPDLRRNGLPSDNLQINLASGNNNLSITNTTINGTPQSYLRVNIPSACTPGVSTANIPTSLVGTDNRADSPAVNKSIRISLENVISGSCHY